MTTPVESPAKHPFVLHPHRTFTTLSLPVMASLVVEPFASLVDTAFVERLGAASAAGLGAATALLSGLLWIFNFLGVGTQTEVAQAMGAGKAQQVGRVASLGMLLAISLGAGADAHHLAGNRALFRLDERGCRRADGYASLSPHSPARHCAQSRCDCCVWRLAWVCKPCAPRSGLRAE